MKYDRPAFISEPYLHVYLSFRPWWRSLTKKKFGNTAKHSIRKKESSGTEKKTATIKKDGKFDWHVRRSGRSDSLIRTQKDEKSSSAGGRANEKAMLCYLLSFIGSSSLLVCYATGIDDIHSGMIRKSCQCGQLTHLGMCHHEELLLMPS